LREGEDGKEHGKRQYWTCRSCESAGDRNIEFGAGSGGCDQRRPPCRACPTEKMHGQSEEREESPQEERRRREADRAAQGRETGRQEQCSRHSRKDACRERRGSPLSEKVGTRNGNATQGAQERQQHGGSAAPQDEAEKQSKRRGNSNGGQGMRKHRVRCRSSGVAASAAELSPGTSDAVGDVVRDRAGELHQVCAEGVDLLAEIVR
jgi:hypothetical protein